MNRSAWDIGKPGTTTSKINDMYKTKTGRDLDDTSGRNMQGFFALAEAINRAGSTEPEKIREALDQDRSQARSAHDGLQRREVRPDRSEHPCVHLSHSAQGQAIQLVWPDRAATAKLEWPMKGWKH